MSHTPCIYNRLCNFHFAKEHPEEDARMRADSLGSGIGRRFSFLGPLSNWKTRNYPTVFPLHLYFSNSFLQKEWPPICDFESWSSGISSWNTWWGNTCKACDGKLEPSIGCEPLQWIKNAKMICSVRFEAMWFCTVGPINRPIHQCKYLWLLLPHHGPDGWLIPTNAQT